MALLTQKQIFDSLIKNELNYNSESDIEKKKTFYNWAYIGVGYLLTHYDINIISPEIINLLNNSSLYQKIYSLYNNDRTVNRINKKNSVDALFVQLDNIVKEIKTLLNKQVH